MVLRIMSIVLATKAQLMDSPLWKNEEGDLTTTIAWIVGISVIAAVAALIVPNIMSSGSKATSSLNSTLTSLP